MQIIYNNNHPPLLYGCIRFFDSKSRNLIRSSDPFVIGKYNPSEELVIFGSIHYLINEMLRLINYFFTSNKHWGDKRLNLTHANADKKDLYYIDDEYEQSAMNFAMTISIHTRNLLDLMDGRIADEQIPLLNYQGQKYGYIRLKEICNTLIHNRYYFFDGNIIQDLFSDKPGPKSSIRFDKFMGYGIDLIDYINGIRKITNSIKIKHLTGILKKKIKDLDVDSTKEDVIFLIQNVFSFSKLMKEKIPTSKYNSMLQLMFHDIPTPKDPNATIQTLYFSNPDIGINENLNNKSFEINVSCGEDKSTLENKRIIIGYEKFFDIINESFGEDYLIGCPENKIIKQKVI